MSQVDVKVSDAAEFREKRDHAEALGLSVERARFFGSWETNNGEPVFLSGECEIEKVGHTYFHLSLVSPNGREVTPCKPADATSTRDAGHVWVKFSE